MQCSLRVTHVAMTLSRLRYLLALLQVSDTELLIPYTWGNWCVTHRGALEEANGPSRARGQQERKAKSCALRFPGLPLDFNEEAPVPRYASYRSKEAVCRHAVTFWISPHLFQPYFSSKYHFFSSQNSRKIKFLFSKCGLSLSRLRNSKHGLDA